MTRALSPLRLAAACFLLYFALGLRGYGNDNDTYHMIDTWNVWLHEGRYQPSRGTGYLVPELLIGASSALGGHVASNALSAALGASVVWLLHSRLLAMLGSPSTAALAALAVALHPGFVVASSTSMDYVYAIAAGAFGLWMLARGRWLAAAPLLAAAVSSRITFAVAIALAGLALLHLARRRAADARAIAAGLAVGGALAVLLYVPAWLAAGRSLAFLTFAQGTEYSLWRALGADLRGQVSFWGIPALVLLLAVATRYARTLSQWWRGRGAGEDERLRALVGVSLLGFAWFELFYLRLPVEPLYLLPALPAACALLAALRSRAEGRLARLALPTLVVASAVQGAVSLTPIALDDPGTSALPALLVDRTAIFEVGPPIAMRSDPSSLIHFGLFVEDGSFAQDLRLRAMAQRNWTRWLHTTWPHHGPRWLSAGATTDAGAGSAPR